MMDKKEKTPGEKLKEEIGFKFKHIAELKPEDIGPSMEFAEGYKSFMNSSKTERECVKVLREMADKEGYTEFDASNVYKAGDRVYFVNRDKNIFIIRIGTNDIAKHGFKIMAAHVDSPRLDLKPNPLYEESGVAYFKTHYYGGIKKYQWPTIALALEGVVVLRGIQAASSAQQVSTGRFIMPDAYSRRNFLRGCPS